jgi:hypothetical protein
MNRILLGALAGMVIPGGAVANDSTAELGTGGLILSRTDIIEMKSEKLFISAERVTVDYVFVSRSDKDIETIVAFPMPDIENNEFGMTAIPDNTMDNFLAFQTVVDGRPVKPELEHKAIAVGIDISDELAAQGVPLFPFGEATYEAVADLPKDVLSDWQTRGIVSLNEYDDGTGWKTETTPFWRLRSTYWWRMTFPAGKEVKVSHRYLPSVGGSAGLSFFLGGEFQGSYDSYKSKYCMDSDFERAIEKIARKSPDGYPPLTETRLSYILTTGGNWALGTIGDFTLTIDKGKPENIVSFCGLGTGVKKTGPTTFEMKAKDYYPERNVDVLILQPYSFGDSETSRGHGGLEGGATGVSPGGRREGKRPAGEAAQ